jgi:hypothetical protein
MEVSQHSAEAENHQKAGDSNPLWVRLHKTVMYVHKKDTHTEISPSAANVPTNSLVDTKQNTNFSKFIICVRLSKLKFELSFIGVKGISLLAACYLSFLMGRNRWLLHVFQQNCFTNA